MLTKTIMLLGALGKLVVATIPIVFGLALLFFFWGMANYILKSGQEKDDGKKIMVWGVVALFVMSSIWGLTKFLGESLGLDSRVTDPKAPSLSR